MSNKKTLTLVLVALLISSLGFAFYWFQYRPTQIRSLCQKEAEGIIRSMRQDSGDIANSNNTPQLNRLRKYARMGENKELNEMVHEKQADRSYKMCLRRHGLKQ